VERSVAILVLRHDVSAFAEEGLAGILVMIRGGPVERSPLAIVLRLLFGAAFDEEDTDFGVTILSGLVESSLEVLIHRIEELTQGVIVAL